ncbi:putative bifunctional diguanylate cyclase/phosphodiesterase [Halioxenophilus sp. WMMB6]|uniref:putative bifunctional diguanylate cyclase/phosphodiesterase n=1 Tax=Halioxenophilus sp. WMMB6 TaxID=3073815 RepID=UPI00295EA00D|nr:EAL domain-containing protein [Halioxenophilus sp. WMMB6]
MSIVLIAGFSVLTINSKRDLQESFSIERQRVFAERKKAINAALATTNQQLQRLASQMQSLALHSPQANKLDALRRNLNLNWEQLHSEWGVLGITLLANELNRKVTWGQPFAIEQLPQTWLTGAQVNETPISRVWCGDSCVQLTIVPVATELSEMGLLVLTTSISEPLLQFQANADVDTGLLINTEIVEENIDLAALPWHYTLGALTGGDDRARLLKSFASEFDFKSVATQRTLYEWQERAYEFSFITLSETKNDSAAIIIIDDVSQELGKLHDTVNYQIVVSISAFLLTELVLLAMLWQPMMRLQTLAKALPKLASDSRQNINPLLSAKHKRDIIRSEIHNLFDASFLLSQTLAELDKIVESRTRRLKNRSQELLQERNFITSLLNNVHVVILTQDYDCQIKMLNSEGLRLFELDEVNFQATHFDRLLGSADRYAFLEGLQQLSGGRANEFNQELNLTNRHGDKIHMEWYHTRLPSTVSEENLILSVGMDLTARKVAEHNLAWLADHDSLTELFNRRRFQLEFMRILANAHKASARGALIFFDIDQFKTVNDTSGHPLGDQLLREVAALLQAFCDPTDVVARLGGDEFAIIKLNCGNKEALEFAETFCESAKNVQYQSQGSTHRISLSIGIALFPDHGRNIDELMANADLAMYRAKAANNARSSWQVYSDDATDKADLYNRQAWKQKIEHALEQQKFVLHFQPILDIHGEKISHFESLLRMEEDNGTLSTPNTFIAVAESTGLIYEIDHQVVRLAVDALEKMHQLDSNISLSVNLSARAVSNKEFVQFVEATCKNRIKDKSKLIFELTETSAVEDVSVAAREIANFRRLGYKFALDDFGVGFSSWYYLRQLPVDFVKIDGSFVRNLAQNVEDRLFVKAINEVAQGLGKHTIAEFVEDQYALSLLTAMGVNFAQGYEIGKPQPLASVLSNFSVAS